MASNFQITFNRREDGIHLRTDGLKDIHPFGVNTFIKRFRITNGSADRIEFTGKNSANLALPSDHWSL